MARDGEAEVRVVAYTSAMHSRYSDGISIRMLRNGDTETVATVFDRLGDESRRLRFGGPKPRLSELELAALARVDATHHVLVAYVDGDPEPVGIARLVRFGRAAEVAFGVADEHQGRRIGSALAGALAADARAAGIVELRATVTGGNRHAVSLLARIALRMRATWRPVRARPRARLSPAAASGRSLASGARGSDVLGSDFGEDELECVPDPAAPHPSAAPLALEGRDDDVDVHPRAGVRQQDGSVERSDVQAVFVVREPALPVELHVGERTDAGELRRLDLLLSSEADEPAHDVLPVSEHEQEPPLADTREAMVLHPSMIGS